MSKKEWRFFEKIAKNAKKSPVQRTGDEVCLLLVCRTGRIELRGAGDGMLFVSDHGLDQLNGTAQAQVAGVEAIVIALHRAPLTGRIILVVG